MSSRCKHDGLATDMKQTHTCYVHGILKGFCIWLFVLLHKQQHHIIMGEGISEKAAGRFPVDHTKE